ncbi:hypothetical protein QR680_005410 [Steinernema hermaphroditum]|uniref:Uncharacterized protein n=1 Tax=Steinernema hermaphroditum TaxID=289476 RepID=A0AA39LVL2_9BILA|nr:hypothetical protein QR680_005410 [Steinernema hermaphroditum]
MLPIPSQLAAAAPGQMDPEMAAMAMNGHWPLPSLPQSSQPSVSAATSTTAHVVASVADSVSTASIMASVAPAPPLLQTSVSSTPSSQSTPNPLSVSGNLISTITSSATSGSITAGTSAAAVAAASAPSIGISAPASTPIPASAASIPIGIKPPAQSPAPGTQAAAKRREIYRFESTKPLFAAAWSYKSSKKFRLAVGTIEQEVMPNKVSVIQLDENTEELVEKASFEHQFAANCIGFIPDKNDQYPDLLATSADCLRIWRLGNDNSVVLDAMLSNSRSGNFASPLTNFDWNEMDPSLIGTCSIDTTCTIWELRTGKAIGTTTVDRGGTTGTVKTQLIAHDKPVHDIKFSKLANGRDHFATVGADGSARMFDLRNLQHSTIVYEDPNHAPLMRLAWNKQDSHFLATFAQDSSEVVIIDIRLPCNPIAKLNNHRLCVNGVAWAPHSTSHICTAGDDHQALIWDLRTMQQRNVEDPILAYQAGGEVNQRGENRQWPFSSPAVRESEGGMAAVSTELHGTANSSSTSAPNGFHRSALECAEVLREDPALLLHRAKKQPQKHKLDPNAPTLYPVDMAGGPPPGGALRHGYVDQQHLAHTIAGDSLKAAQASLEVPSANTAGVTATGVSKRKEIYRFDASFNLYTCGWSYSPDPAKKFRLATGSFIEEYNNKVMVVQLDEPEGEFRHLCTFEHPYPTTKVLWIPDTRGVCPDLLATTGDYLRIWRVGEQGATLDCQLNNNRSSEYCAPLTSADWNEVDLSLLVTSSIDTTCTIWQIETGQALGQVGKVDGNVKTQLIAHDKEVYDVAFSRLGSGRDMFASVGADGSVRMFDLRHLEHSTIIFEEPNRKALLKLAWNKQDHNYLATFGHNSNEVFILDIRIPCTPVARLENHRAGVTGVAWAPHSSSHICTAGEDSQALIWDIHEMPKPIDDPILAYQAAGEIGQVQWSTQLTDFVAITYGKSLEILRV